MSATPIRPRRSLIFAPGNKPDMFPKAVATGADIVCVDLEDAVAPHHKADARAATVPLFAGDLAQDLSGPEKMVRLNALSSPDGVRDLAAFLDAAALPHGFMLPKVSCPDEVRLLDEVLTEAGAKTRLHVIVETNRGLDAAVEIAKASDRIASLLFGGVDMAADLRTPGGWENLLYARSRAVHAAAGAGVDLIDVPWLDLEDMDGMAREARASRDLGFTGKGAIHPKQIPVLNEIFSPSDAEIARARRIIQAFDESDSGLVVIDGKLIEKPVLRTMYRVVAVAEAAGR